MSTSRKYYPARSRRQCSITHAKTSGDRVWIAGRVIELGSPQKNSGILRDEGDEILFLLSQPTDLKIGDIIELYGNWKDKEFLADDYRLLTPAQKDFRQFVSEAPQWLRLLQDPEKRKIFYLRQQIIQEIRNFFLAQGFLEVDAPALVPHPGMEPHLNPFETRFIDANAQSLQTFYLHTSPEYAMKKLLATGFEKIFYLGHCFRNSEVSATHHPEFLMLEWYRAYADYHHIMADCEALITHLARQIKGGFCFRYQNQEIDLTPPWPRMSVAEAMQRFAGVNLKNIRSRDDWIAVAQAKNYDTVDASWSWEDIFFLIFLNEVEPKIACPLAGQARPIFLVDYPAALASLAKRKVDEPNFVERFELYIGGLELANAFTELNDPKEQYQRLLHEQKVRKQLRRPVFKIDAEFITALEIGIPPAGGIALGVDRLIMLLLDKSHLEDVLFFPFRQWIASFGAVELP